MLNGELHFKVESVSLKLWIIGLTTIALFFVMSSLKYYSLHSSLLDLGLFQSEIYGRIYFDGSNRATFQHVQWVIYVYTSMAQLLPVKYIPYLLFFLQGAIILLPVFIIYYLLDSNKLIWIAYLLFFPIWFNALFDFHLDHLAILFTVMFFVFVQLERIGLATFSAIALVLVKEPFALQTAMCGIYLLGIHWNNSYNSFEYDSFSFKNIKVYFYGVCLIVFGFGYFYIATSYIIPLYSGGQVAWLKSEAFSWLGSSISEMLWYMLTHPIEIIVEIFTTPGKVIYLVALFGALGFIPLLKPAPLIVALPILAISLLSRHEGYYGLGHHYTAGLIAPMIFAFAGGLPRAKMIWQRVGVGGFRLPVKWFVPVLVTGLVAAHVALAPSPIGRLFWSDKVWAYSYQAYIPTERDAMIKQAIADFVPTDPEVVVSIQNTVNWAPLVQRRHFLLFPQGITEGQQVPFFGKGLWPPEVEWKPVMADYVVLDLKRPWFLVDKGCEWLYGKCTNEEMAEKYLDWVAKSREVMHVVFEKDGFLILSRGN